MAGKDRTGVAVALLLDLLGVNRATIMRDYLVSVGVADQVWERLSAEHPAFLTAGRKSWDPLVRCQPAYLEAYFDTIDRDYGSAAGYLESALELGPADCASIRAGLIETRT
jgi:protein-tyrosine phosphatase